MRFTTIVVLALLGLGSAGTLAVEPGDRALGEAVKPRDTVAYCSDLKRITILALTKERFASILGSVREGSFSDTTLPLTGWKDCSLYGSRTYTCESHALSSDRDAATSQEAIVAGIKSCLGEGWSEDKDRSSPTYVVVRSSRAPVSMTVSTGSSDDDGYVVRLTLFPRSGD